MTDDDREGFEPEAAPDDAGDPAAAFEALRRTIEKQGGQIGAEMTVIRRGVEAAFDQFEKYRQPPDYGADLGKIIQFLAGVEERLEAVEQSPILRNGPEHYARALERSGEGLVRTAVLELERRATDLEREAVKLADYTKSAYDRKSQDLRMWMVGLAGLAVGVFLILLLPRILPFAADTHVAAIVMGYERADAGRVMIRAAAPDLWRELDVGRWVYLNNAEAVDGCISRMQEAGEAQSCTVTIPAVAQGR